MIDLLIRALRLARSNPRLFRERLLLAARSPRWYLRARRVVTAERAAVQQSYDGWRAARPVSEGRPRGPLFSVIMPVRNTDPRMLDEAIASVAGQSYGDWELCIADDASERSGTRSVLDRWVADPRVRMVRRDMSGHISAASNSALAEAQGEFVVLLDHDDLLAPNALARFAEAAAMGGVDLIYSDEDKLDPAGNHIEPFFKPAWSPTLLLSCNYITHLAAIRRSLVEDAGGFRTEMVGSQDYDLFLRVTEHSRRISHIPDILYSWRQAPDSTARASVAKPYAVDASRRAIEDAVTRRGMDGRVDPTILNGIHVVRRDLPGTVSVGLMAGRASPAAQALARTRNIRVVDPSSADYLIWLADGAVPRNGDWLSALLEPLVDLGVAFSGGMTVSRRDDVLQAGMIVTADAIAPAFAGVPNLPHSNFYLNLKDLPREVSVVHPSICAVRRETYLELGNAAQDAETDLAIADMCLTAIEQDYRNVYVPAARISVRADAVPRVPTGETWPWRSYRDPYWNPNLSPTPDGLPFRLGSWPARALPAGTLVAAPF